MNKHINKAALFLPFVYIAVIVALVFLQFSGGGVVAEVANSNPSPRNSAGSPSSIYDWFFEDIENITPSDYNRRVQDYINNAYRAWLNSRYNETMGTWQHGEGAAEFSENILVSLLSEAWIRGEFSAVFPDMQAAANAHSNNLSLESSVYLGNLRSIMNAYGSTELRRNAAINAEIAAENAEVFLTEDLNLYLLSSPNTALVEFLESLARRLEERAANGARPVDNESTRNGASGADGASNVLTSLEALGIAMNYFLVDNLNTDIRSALRPFVTLIDAVLLPQVVSVNEGFFFAVEPGRVQSFYSIVAGLVLIEYGREFSSEQYSLLGRNLVLSVLELADSVGYIPANLEIIDGRISAEAGILYPEELYRFLHANPQYPQYIDLSPYFGAGAWGYGIFPELQSDLSDNAFTLSFEHNPRNTHYMVFRGMPPIDPFSGMELFGIVWRSAADFEIYPRGRFYDTDTNTLMIKFFDDDAQQNVVIFTNTQ